MRTSTIAPILLLLALALIAPADTRVPRLDVITRVAAGDTISSLDALAAQLTRGSRPARWHFASVLTMRVRGPRRSQPAKFSSRLA